MHESDDFLLENSEVTLGVFGDDVRPSGRPLNDKMKEKTRGLEMRDKFCELIREAGKSRPGNNAMIAGRDRHNRMTANE